ncbi:MAG TPA: hypothetical protein PK784_01165 [Tenuifilaceae bacterium]|nr:hypothetical protein [Tenuifilaceae bacterium]
MKVETITYQKSQKNRKGFILITLGFLLIGSVFSSCKKDETVPNKVPVVYITGCGIAEEGSAKLVAKLWENGETQILSEESSRAFARSVFVSGNDVYVGGYVLYDENNGFIATIWKNGNVLYKLSDGTVSEYVHSVYVSGNDVYACGFAYLGSGVSIAKLWKNGVEQYLDLSSESNSNSSAYSVFVSNSDVYVVGSARTGQYGFFNAKLWKNGVEQYLDLSSESNSNSSANSVFVSNSDVYVVGSKTWKNGSVLYNNSGGSIFVSGNDVYVAGAGFKNGNWVAKLCKNGIEQILTDGTNEASANSVYVLNNDVYVVGYEDGIGIRLWKNGAIQDFSNAMLWGPPSLCPVCVFVK